MFALLSWPKLTNRMAKLMRNFDWSLARPDQPWTEGSYGGLLAHKDMWVLASEREEVG